MNLIYSRRGFLSSSLAGALIIGCRTPESSAPALRPDAQPPPPMPYGPGPQVRNAAPAAGSCALTADNIEGPYYRAGAPERANLVAPGTRGELLTLKGRVLAPGCNTPISGALIDLWQANGDGHYDIDGSPGMDPRGFMLRGKVHTDASGAFSVQTVIPGRYLNGRQYRPAHIHAKLSAPGFAPLTTQLYFPDDPYNDVDPFVVRSLIMKVSPGPSSKLAEYDFVLRQA
jgi:hypothetical protein